MTKPSVGDEGPEQAQRLLGGRDGLGREAEQGGAVVPILLRGAVFLGSAAIGLLVASLLVSGMSVGVSDFVVAVIIFAAAKAILSPFFATMASRYASAFLGGVGPVSTLVEQILSSVLTDGLSIRGIGSWISATVLVWLITALATVLLPMVLVKKKLSGSD